MDGRGQTWIFLTWISPIDRIFPIARYIVTAVNTNSLHTFKSSTINPTTRLNITNLHLGTTYTFEVQAVAGGKNDGLLGRKSNKIISSTVKLSKYNYILSCNVEL